jgi:hypothetical protein
MTENTMPTNNGHQSEQTDLEQAVQQAPQDQADSQVPLGQTGSSTTGIAPARKPLFRS